MPLARPSFASELPGAFVEAFGEEGVVLTIAADNPGGAVAARAPVRGIVRIPEGEDFARGDGGAVVSQPFARLMVEDCVGVAEGDLLTFDGVTFKIFAPRNEGQGMVHMDLQVKTGG